MFHHDDHLRFSTLSPRLRAQTVPLGEMRQTARNTDLNAFLDKVGLAGRARKL